MEKYIIYKHTFENGKSYIGYTKKSIIERLNEHIKLSEIPKTKFQRAIHKYGVNKIESSILFESSNIEEVLEKEIFYIKEYDTINNGYNIANGGSGGWVIGNLDKESYTNYITKRSIKTTGSNNPNFSGVSDEELISHGVIYYMIDNIFTINGWKKYATENKIPKKFSKNRFNGSYNEFKKIIANKIGIEKLNSYIKTEEHKNKLSKQTSNQFWITNGLEVKKINKEEINNYDSSWRRGRLLKNNTI